jgi:hypothetical protein
LDKEHQSLLGRPQPFGFSRYLGRHDSSYQHQDRKTLLDTTNPRTQRAHYTYSVVHASPFFEPHHTTTIFFPLTQRHRRLDNVFQSISTTLTAISRGEAFRKRLVVAVESQSHRHTVAHGHDF